ncbi:MAG: winged helix DNA-binding protein [Chloroflexota bacterium]
MNFEAIKNSLEDLNLENGFQPADLLDFPEEVVPILKQMMTRRGKSVADLSTALRWQESETSELLTILENKGLVQQKQKNNVMVFTANMK